MVKEAVLDALQKDKRYTKAIVSLAGIRTASAEGPMIDIAARWDGEKFVPPLTYSMDWMEVGRISWTGENPDSRLYKLTLKKLEDQFRAMRLPPRMVFFQAVISLSTKKPHFLNLVFSDIEALPIKYKPEVLLNRKDWDAEELETNVRELLRRRRSLKGMGYSDAY